MQARKRKMRRKGNELGPEIKAEALIVYKHVRKSFVGLFRSFVFDIIDFLGIRDG